MRRPVLNSRQLGSAAPPLGAASLFRQRTDNPVGRGIDQGRNIGLGVIIGHNRGLRLKRHLDPRHPFDPTRLFFTTGGQVAQVIYPRESHGLLSADTGLATSAITIVTHPKAFRMSTSALFCDEERRQKGNASATAMIGGRDPEASPSPIRSE